METKSDLIKEQAEQIAKVMMDIQEAATERGYEVLQVESRLQAWLDPRLSSIKITLFVPFPDTDN